MIGGMYEPSDGALKAETLMVGADWARAAEDATANNPAAATATLASLPVMRR